MKHRAARLLAFAGALAVTTLAPGRGSAETKKIAVVMGNNAGSLSDVALRFAEADASKMARVLVELGSFAPSDVLLLEGRRLGDLNAALEAARARISRWHEQSEVRVLFLFYFSGHSDGQALDLGPERLTFAQLRTLVAALGADVRLVILDSCRSGSALQSKGGRPAKAFDIHLADDLPDSGEVLMTSSAWDESSLESPELRGSFFTHHLVTGLRGAADASGDRRVSLAEAYEYAFTHTIVATADTLSGAQHPSFDYRLSGRGELILTELRGQDAGLIVPAGYQRVLITHVLRDQVVAEVTADLPGRLMLQPGVYTLRAWRGQREYVGRVTLNEGEDCTVKPSDLAMVPPLAAVEKGFFDVDRRADVDPGRQKPLLALSVGPTTGVGQPMGAMMAGEIGLRSRGLKGWAMDMDGAYGKGRGFDEVRFLLLAGYRLQWAAGAVSTSISVDAGGGLITQRESARLRMTPAAAAGSSIEFAWSISSRVAIDIKATGLAGAYEREGKLGLSLWPQALGGVCLSL